MPPSLRTRSSPLVFGRACLLADRDGDHLARPKGLAEELLGGRVQHGGGRLNGDGPEKRPRRPGAHRRARLASKTVDTCWCGEIQGLSGALTDGPLQ